MKRVLLTGLLLFSVYGLYAQKPSLAFSSGYQSEDFRWSIAGNTQGANPNIYSELKWTNLAGPTLAAEADWNFWKKFHIHAAYSHMFITAGSVTDMDYQGDNRTDRSYYGAFDANKGMSFSLRTTLEDDIWSSELFTLTALLGYSLHRQSLYLLSPDLSGSAAGLHSTYDTKYTGGVVGLGGRLQLRKRFSLEGSMLYEPVTYRGQADWNLIASFRHPLSFEDKANGFNIEGSLRFSYYLTNKWALFASGNILHGETNSGTDWLYMQNGQNLPTQFNGAVRDYIRACAGVRWLLFGSQTANGIGHGGPDRF
ncbi:MAG TPA: hypothetical protein VHD83_12785 [Puia sp.]|nr:hypothetical protein [Puia sp.]